METILCHLRAVALVSFLFLWVPWAQARTTSLVPAGAVWSYLDNGSDPGTAWIAPGFDHSTWAAGPAQLGYGDNDEATVVGFGTDVNKKYVATYFRRDFEVEDAAGFTRLSLRVVRDDGVVAYLNGTEICRNNMPSGTITSTTLASTAIGSADESAFHEADVSPSLLVEGRNVLAIEIHQASANSSDISFDLELAGERPTILITLDGPTPGATGLSLSARLGVSVSHRDSVPMAVAFVGRAAPPVQPDFTLVALPDTQYYSSSLGGGSPAIFNAQTDWIVANKAARNIVFVTQLGDCVENGDNNGDDLEWRNATNALYRLENPATTFLAHGIPYGIAVGNHDQSPIGSATGTTTFYNQYFGEAHFWGRPYYGGHHAADNDVHFELFSGGGINFIIIHLEYDTAMTTNSPALDWASQLLQTHRDRQAILVSHWIMNSGENGSFSSQGKAIYDRLKVKPNLFLMLCGHVSPNGEGKRADVYNGKTVHTLLADYQDRLNGGNGWLRILEFSPASSVIRVRTYSPTLNQFETDINSQFDLHYDMRSLLGNPYTTIAVDEDIPSGSSTTAVWTNLAPSTEYEWYVTVSDGVETVNSPVWRCRTVDQTLPLAPSALTATAQSSSDILLTWTDNASNESQFEIYQSVDGVNFSSVGTVGADVTSALVTTLDPATPYYYRVRAVNGAGYSADSNLASTTTWAPPPQPAAPSDLTVVPTSTSQLTLNWTDNAGNEDGFRVERSSDGVIFVEVNSVAANVTVYSDPDLEALTIYYYRVRAYNIGGASDYSSPASATTQPPPAPPAPTGLTAIAGDRSIALTWTKSPGADRYHVHRSSVSGGPYNLAAYGVYSPAYVESVGAPHTPYFYVVTALNDGGESPYSNEASAIPYALPAAPTGAAVIWVEATSLELAWADSASDETGYWIERSVDAVSFTVIANLPSNSVFHADTGLTENTTYYYRIWAFNDDGQSATVEVFGTTLALPPDPPSNLSGRALSGSRVDLVWTDNAINETGFKLDRSERDGPFLQVAILSANVTAYSNTGLSSATTYAYRLRSFNSAGDSAFAEASVSTLIPLQFTGILSVSNGAFNMRLTGSPGAEVVVESSWDQTTWTPVETNTLRLDGLDLAMPMGTNQCQFFRARSRQP